MAQIHKLDQETINQIAAGEVIERPMAVVKELVENAIDAKATAITVEIEEGGKRLIRVTDNGSGIPEDEIALAFAPHATSKILQATDLFHVKSLGFRGEALSSIAAVSQLEMLTKPKKALTGTRCLIDGGVKKEQEQVGCPDGSTILVRNLFYNTPARLKFLKTAQTEAGYIGSMIEYMALSRPDIAFRFISQKQTKLSTSGNGKLKDVIFHIYGREVAAELLVLEGSDATASLTGFIGKPAVSRGNRSMISCFINGRYIKSPFICRAVEQAYAPYTMQHRYPFAVLCLSVLPETVDVNVHPQKMEIRFHNEPEIFELIYHSIFETLKHRELIPQVTYTPQAKEKEKTQQPPAAAIEPFEEKRHEEAIQKDLLRETAPYHVSQEKHESAKSPIWQDAEQAECRTEEPFEALRERAGYQETFLEQGMVSETEKIQKEVKIIGQVFATYWILQYEDKLYLVDQHAAHEKVLYERLVKKLKEKESMMQLLQPPVILTLSMTQEQAVKENEEILQSLGYQIEPFGGREYAVTGVPAHLPQINTQELLSEIIDSLAAEQARTREPEVLLEKLASMSCKAAVKGNSRLPAEQMEALLKELLTLENPYHCPHGRPTMLCMTKKELEKRFKRIQ